MKLPKSTVVFSECLQYLSTMILANLAGTAVLLTLLNFLRALFADKGPLIGVAGYTAVTLLSLISFAVSLTVMCVLFKRMYDDLFSAELPLSTVHINALALILPAELLRFFFFSLPWQPGEMFGLHCFDGIFTIIPSFLYNQLYLNQHGGTRRIREDGYLPADHTAYMLIYLAYFLLLCTAVLVIFRVLHRKAQIEKAEKERRYAEDAKKSAREYVLKRDFFYSTGISRENRLRYAALSFGAHLAAYLIAGPALTTLLTIYTGDSATNILLQILFGIPLAAVLPPVFMHRLMKKQIPPIISLADEEKDIPQKLFSLIAPVEAIRFAVGLLPFMGYGAYTAPLSAMLFSLIHRILTGGFEADAVETAPTMIHLILFFFIYLLCFAVQERIMQKLICRSAKTHIRYLAGVQAEKDKYQHYYHR